MSCIIIFIQHTSDVHNVHNNAYLRWIFSPQTEISPFKHHMLYFRKVDYCEQIFYSLIYAANNILVTIHFGGNHSSNKRKIPESKYNLYIYMWRYRY